MGKTFRAELSKQSIDALIKQLKDYEEELNTKCKKFVSRLSEEGIKVAMVNRGEYGDTIGFKTELKASETGATALMVATGQGITRSWRYKGEYKTAVINPLLMAEFGSGWLADTTMHENVPGNVGQGTFPGQKHAFDEAGWYWTTPDGVRHHSYGEAPTYPMYRASVAMINKINEVAREVFE